MIFIISENLIYFGPDQQFEFRLTDTQTLGCSQKYVFPPFLLSYTYQIPYHTPAPQRLFWNSANSWVPIISDIYIRSTKSLSADLLPFVFNLRLYILHQYIAGGLGWISRSCFETASGKRVKEIYFKVNSIIHFKTYYVLNSFYCK